jgi:selenide,water dikinase
MARASGVTIEFEAAAIPVFPGVLEIAAGNRSGGLASNEEHFAAAVRVAPEVDAARRLVLFDPQTSGGLLVAAAADAAGEVAARLKDAGVEAPRIGTAQEPLPGLHLVVRG